MVPVPGPNGFQAETQLRSQIQNRPGELSQEIEERAREIEARKSLGKMPSRARRLVSTAAVALVILLAVGLYLLLRS